MLMLSWRSHALRATSSDATATTLTRMVAKTEMEAWMSCWGVSGALDEFSTHEEDGGNGGDDGG